METLWQDLKFSVRMLAKNRGFTVVAVLTLALGISVNTAIFGIVNAVLLRPLDFPNPHELVVAVRTGTPKWDGVVSYADFLDWSQRATSFQSVGALASGSQIFDAPSGPELIRGGRVSAGFFRTMGVRPTLGRDFLPEDDTPGAGPVVIISHLFWVNRLDGDVSAVGRMIVLNSKAHTVVGVLPPTFRSPFHVESSEMLWIPLDAASTGMTGRAARWLTLIARLKHDVPLRQASAEVEALSRAAYQDPAFAKDPRRAGFALLALQQQVAREVGGLLWLLPAVAGFVLLIACANLIGLQLSRNIARQTELAVRAALGASRTRLVGLMVTETLLVALAGGTLGLLSGAWIADAIRASLPFAVPRLEDIPIDWRVVLFTAGVAMACGLLSGVLPALGASRTNLWPKLKQSPSAGTARPVHLRSMFAVAQTALAVVLLAGGGLMLRSLIKMLNVDTGFSHEGIMTADVRLLRNYNASRCIQVFREMQERIGSVGSVRAVGLVDMVPLGDFRSISGATADQLAEGVRPEMIGQEVTFEHRNADEAYFRAMAIPLLRGRLFTPDDERKESLGVIVSENLARTLWGDADPIGRRINSGLRAPLATVVGIVGAVRHASLTTAPNLTLYRPFAATGGESAVIVVRTEGDSAQLAPTLRDLVVEVDRSTLVRSLQTMAKLHARAAAVPRFLTMLLSSFALLGLVLAVVGLFSVMSYQVVQQTREFGVRMALGAQRGDIVGQVLRRGVLLVGAGLFFGLGGAWWLTRFMKSLLYSVEPTDPLTYAAVSVGVVLVMLAACWIPARRAAKVDPMVALRYE